MKITPEMHDEVINFINTTTTQQQMYFLQCISEKISISIQRDKYVESFTLEDPFCNVFLNGIYIEILINEKEQK